MKKQVADVKKILVSACLVGEKVRYDGHPVHFSNDDLDRWRQKGRVLAFCPEKAGGLSVPRSPSEIVGDGGGRAVIAGHAKVINRKGYDVTGCFIKGAQRVLEMALLQGVKLAVMKDGSPSCGSSYIYNGSFSGARRPGQGVTAALLEDCGIRVFSEHRIAEAAAYLKLGGDP